MSKKIELPAYTIVGNDLVYPCPTHAAAVRLANAITIAFVPLKPRRMRDRKGNVWQFVGLSSNPRYPEIWQQEGTYYRQSVTHSGRYFTSGDSRFDLIEVVE